MTTPQTAETLRAAVIAAMEKQGAISPGCRECQQAFYAHQDPSNAFYPRHTPMVSCQSGKHPHCTCDTCF
jgi:hypothetical protein